MGRGKNIRRNFLIWLRNDGFWIVKTVISHGHPSGNSGELQQLAKILRMDSILGVGVSTDSSVRSRMLSDAKFIAGIFGGRWTLSWQNQAGSLQRDLCGRGCDVDRGRTTIETARKEVKRMA
jgi:hypothetical protein